MMKVFFFFLALCASGCFASPTPLTLLNGWASVSNYESLSYDSDSYSVILSGSVTDVGATSSLVAVIPALINYYSGTLGQPVYFSVPTTTGKGMVKIDFYGNIWVLSGSGTITFDGLAVPVLPDTSAYAYFGFTPDLNSDFENSTLVPFSNFPTSQAVCYLEQSTGVSYAHGTFRTNLFVDLNSLDLVLLSPDVPLSVDDNNLPAFCRLDWAPVVPLPSHYVDGPAYITMLSTTSSHFYIQNPSLAKTTASSLSTVGLTVASNYRTVSTTGNWTFTTTPVSYFIDFKGVVHLRGVLQRGGSGNVICSPGILPFSHRDHILITAASCGNNPACDPTGSGVVKSATLVVTRTGALILDSVTQGFTLEDGEWITLDSLSYVRNADVAWAPFPAFDGGVSSSVRKFQCVNYYCNDPEIFKDSEGVVHVRGVVYWPNGPGAHLFTLTSYHLFPLSDILISVATDLGQRSATVDSETGIVTLNFMDTNEPITWISFDGVRWLSTPVYGSMISSSTWTGTPGHPFLHSVKTPTHYQLSGTAITFTPSSTNVGTIPGYTNSDDEVRPGVLVSSGATVPVLISKTGQISLSLAGKTVSDPRLRATTLYFDTSSLGTSLTLLNGWAVQTAFVPSAKQLAGTDTIVLAGLVTQPTVFAQSSTILTSVIANLGVNTNAKLQYHTVATSQGIGQVSFDGSTGELKAIDFPSGPLNFVSLDGVVIRKTQSSVLLTNGWNPTNFSQTPAVLLSNNMVFLQGSYWPNKFSKPVANIPALFRPLKTFQIPVAIGNSKYVLVEINSASGDIKVAWVPDGVSFSFLSLDSIHFPMNTVTPTTFSKPGPGWKHDPSNWAATSYSVSPHTVVNLHAFGDPFSTAILADVSNITTFPVPPKQVMVIPAAINRAYQPLAVLPNGVVAGALSARSFNLREIVSLDNIKIPILQYWTSFTATGCTSSRTQYSVRSGLMTVRGTFTNCSPGTLFQVPGGFTVSKKSQFSPVVLDGSSALVTSTLSSTVDLVSIGSSTTTFFLDGFSFPVNNPPSPIESYEAQSEGELVVVGLHRVSD